MEKLFLRRANRNEDRGSNPEAEANEAAWKSALDLYQGLLEQSPDRIATRERINAFVRDLKARYGRADLQKYRLYDLLIGGSGAGTELDLPKDEIQKFLDNLFLEVITKKAKS